LLLLAGVVSCGESDNDNDGSSADSGSNAANGSSQTAATTTSTTSASSSSSATTSGGTTTDTTGSGGGTSSANTTTSTAATSVGGAANANLTSASTTNGGGSGGDSGSACPPEPPVNGGTCEGLGLGCAYEDCDGAGRSIAQCTQGTWFVDTGACGEAVNCSAGSDVCAAGEICLVMAGGALLSECVPNTCDGEAVTCDCIESCVGECPVYGTVEMGITITCNTCPSGLCP